MPQVNADYGFRSPGILEVKQGYLGFSVSGRRIEALDISASYDIIHSTGVIKTQTSFGPLFARVHQDLYDVNLKLRQVPFHWSQQLMGQNLPLSTSVTGSV